MEQVVRNYGSALLNILAVGLLMLYLFSTVTDEAGNQGILNIIGANIQTEEINYQDYTDFTVYAEESVKEAPSIIYDASATMSVGINKITDYIKAADYAGNEISVKVDSIQNPYQVELINTYNPDTAEVELSQPGIYIMEVSAVDDIHKKSVCRIRIPVNKGKGGNQ